MAAAVEAADVVSQRELGNPEAWAPLEGSPPAQAVREDGRNILKLPCPFSTHEGWRVGWDLALEKGLGDYRWIKIRVRADDPEAVSGISLYFNSGSGWYVKGMGGIPGKWSSLIAERASFGSEGTPAAWDAVRGLRIGIMPGVKRDTTVYVEGISATSARAPGDAARIGPFESLQELEEALKDEPLAAEGLRRGADLLARAARKRNLESEKTQKLVSLGREALANAYLKTRRPREPEFRGIWCHQGTGPGMGWTKAIDAVADGGLNALLPNLLWSGIAYYPSRIVPEAPEVRDKGDQLREILTAAKRRGVAVHVWKVCWQFGWAADPGVAVPFRFADRMMVDRNGKQGEWLCPSNEENRRYELDAIRELVRNYEIDGFHLDYIRYPGDEFCFCRACRRNFEKETGEVFGNWPAPVLGRGEYSARYRDWRRDVITSFVAEVRDEIRMIRKDVKLSAAVFPHPEDARESVLQDWTRWVREGLVDFVCPMNYTESVWEMRGRLKAGLEAVNGRVPLYAGLYATFSPAQRQEPDMLAAQIEAAREMGASGFVLFEMQDHVLQDALPLLRVGITAPPAPDR